MPALNGGAQRLASTIVRRSEPVLTPTPTPDIGAARTDSTSLGPLRLQRVLIVALAYGLIGKACLLLSGPATQWAPLWLPMGVLMALWLRWGGASVAGVLIGARGPAGRTEQFARAAAGADRRRPVRCGARHLGTAPRGDQSPSGTPR